jgi:hypothetical protein
MVKMSVCPNLINIVILGTILYICSTIFRTYYVQRDAYEYHVEENENELIGLIYPPKAGPLHTNIEFPTKRESCKGAFTAIYKQDPYLKVYNQNPGGCV